MSESEENDLMPRSFPNLQKPEVKKPVVRKPIEETTKTPNSPWLMLESAQVNADEEDGNDINFDIDKNFRFRMPSDQNFKGQDVKFNVKLPQDMITGKPAP